VVRLLANPMVLPAAVVLVIAICAFVFGIWVIRGLRRNIAAEADLDSSTAPTLENLPLHLYNTVIQQLKQQKHELQVQTLAEQRRARTTENFSQAVLSNLSSGVLVFGLNGLVKQSNPAAKEILGFHSAAGMSAADPIRNGHRCRRSGQPLRHGRRAGVPVRAGVADAPVVILTRKRVQGCSRCHTKVATVRLPIRMALCCSGVRRLSLSPTSSKYRTCSVPL